MKKTLSAVIVAAACVSTAWSSVLVWYVDTTEALGLSKNETFDSMKFFAVDGVGTEYGLGSATYAGIPMDSGTSAGSGDTVNDLDGTTDTFAGQYFTDLSGLIGDASGYSFKMVLYKSGKEWDSTPDNIAYSVLTGHMLTDAELSDLNVVALKDGYNFASTMTPEPTGGMLMLLGGALLVLRRRKASK